MMFNCRPTGCRDLIENSFVKRAFTAALDQSIMVIYRRVQEAFLFSSDVHIHVQILRCVLQQRHRLH